MEDFVRARPTRKTPSSFDVRGKHTWDEVLREVDNAKEVYELKAKGNKGMHIRVGRAIGAHSDVVSPWLELLPNGDYSSIICGGLKFVFGVCRHSGIVAFLELANRCLSRLR